MDTTALGLTVSIGQLAKFIQILESNGMGAAEIQRFIDDLQYRQGVLNALRANNFGYRLPEEFDEDAARYLIRYVFAKDINRELDRRRYRGELEPTSEWDNADGYYSHRRNPLEFLAQPRNLRKMLEELKPLRQEMIVMRSGLEGAGEEEVEAIAQYFGFSKSRVSRELRLARETLWEKGNQLLAATRSPYL